MNDERSQHLLMRYFDGTISTDECEELNALLLRSDAARDDLREVAVQVVSLGDLARERQIEIGAKTEQLAIRSAWHWWKKGLVAACLLLGLLGVVYSQLPAEQDIVLTQTSGSVKWTDGQLSNNRFDLQPGARISSGLIQVEGSAASAELKFVDGTTITLGGDTELSVEAKDQKRLYLKSGSFSADVTPQPKSKAMRIQTSTATVDVIGTRFSLRVQGNQTTLAVEHGDVSMQRLSDGKTEHVASGEIAVASLEENTPLRVPDPPRTTSQWHAQFDQRPSEHWEGSWVAPMANERGYLRNVREISARKSDGTPLASFTVNVRDNSGGIAAVSSKSVLHIKYRVAQGHEFLALIGLYKAEGGFAGNFQTLVSSKSATPDAQGWLTQTIPFSKLGSKFPEHPSIRDNARVFLIYFACYSPLAQLEISEVSIELPNSQP